MPRQSRPWFRFYVEAVHDRKLRRLTPAQRWLWVVVLAAARQSPIPGVLMVSVREPLEDDELADMSGLSVKDVRATLPRFVQSEMLERDPMLDAWSVINWASRQFESDNVTERTRKHRSKERSNDVPANTPETEADSEPETYTSSSSHNTGSRGASRADDDDLEEAELRTDEYIAGGGEVENRPAFVAKVLRNLREERANVYYAPSGAQGPCFPPCDDGWLMGEGGMVACETCLPGAAAMQQGRN